MVGNILDSHHLSILRQGFWHSLVIQEKVVAQCCCHLNTHTNSKSLDLYWFSSWLGNFCPADDFYANPVGWDMDSTLKNGYGWMEYWLLLINFPENSQKMSIKWMRRQRKNPWRQMTAQWKSKLMHRPHLPYTVRCLYNVVNFFINIHKRHPIARLLGRGMGCLLWIQCLIHWYSAARPAIIYAISYYFGPRYNGTQLYYVAPSRVSQNPQCPIWCMWEANLGSFWTWLKR